jgi:ABC-type uncharacterized transport system involved in gliding motility auxiliary subunit
MNFRGLFLAMAVAVALFAAIVIQILATKPYFAAIGWAVTALLAVLWVFSNRSSVVSFFTKKSTRYGANVALVIFLVFGIMVFLNVIAKQHSYRKDFTRGATNSLSEQSVKILDGLNQDVTAYYFGSLNEKEKGEDLLRRFSYVAKHFKYEFVDVERNPTRAEAMGVKRKDTVILSLGDGTKHISVNEGTEEAITNGLIKLLRSSEVAVYFTAGHEEHPLAPESDAMGYSQLKGEMEKQGYTVKELNLFTEGKIPADAALVVIGGPHKAFFPKELDLLSAWIKDGGHALIAVDLDLNQNGLANGSKQMVDLVKPYGVDIMNLMLVDPLSQNAKVDPSVILGFASGKDHPITKDFPHSVIGANFMFPITTFLTHPENPPDTITALATTSPQAWALSDWASLRKGQAKIDQSKDHKGPMDLAYAVEGKKKAGARAVKLVVFANALFATNNLIDKVGNRDLILNSAGWLVDEDKFISIRPKESQDALKQFNNSVISVILLVSVFVVPLILVGMGTLVWWRRSKL